MKTKTLIISLLLAATAAAQNARVAVTKDPATGALSNSFTVPSGITVTVAPQHHHRAAKREHG